MTILNQLACAMDRFDEVPNVELGQKLARANDKEAILELVQNLKNKDKAVASDCIKVLYEAGEINPQLIAPHFEAFFEILTNKNNRMVWGAMIAIAKIAAIVPDKIFALFEDFERIGNAGSVITKDNFVRILVALMDSAEFRARAFAALSGQLQTCPDNQFPMYCEFALPKIGASEAGEFVEILKSRLENIQKPSPCKRIEKAISIVSKLL